MIFIYLFGAFFRIGIFSFGGGLAMLPLIFQSVQEFGMMSADKFSDLVAISQVTPGPIAVNAATFVGFDYAGFAGAAIATLGVSLPAFIIMLIVMKFIDKFNDSRYVQGAFVGIRPVTVGMIAAAALFVGEGIIVKGTLVSAELFKSGFDYFNLVPVCIFALTVLLVGVFKMKPIRIMIIMGIAGALLCG